MGFPLLRGIPAVSLMTAAPAFPDLTERVIDTYVLPRFERLGKASDSLAADLEALCRGERGRLRAVRKDFEGLVRAWAQIEFLRFGPMSVMGRPERFAFWPDPRGVVQRQLNVLIARRDPTALEPASLAGKSAAVQGLPALEMLLADAKHPLNADDVDGRYRCRLALSIAQNLAAIAREILSDWGGDEGWRRSMLEPGPQNARYRAPAESAAEFARALVTGLQMLQDRQVAPLIAAQAAPGRAPRLPFSQSGLDAAYVASAVASLKALYEAMGLAGSVPPDKAWMKEWIPMAFNRLAHDAPAAVEAKVGEHKDPERERALRLLRFHVEGIRKLVGRELAPLAGLTIGFNELDGD